MDAGGLLKKLREIVDEALPLNGASYKDLYFGAVELNGSGIRFYGDICLVLKAGAVPANTIILDRNSFDLIRPPIRERIKNGAHRRREAMALAGCWKDDLGAMAGLMVFENLGFRKRLLTTGQISAAVRSDEDYIEVLKIGSFSGSDLQEARFSAEDAACDALTGDRIGGRPTPRLEALMLRHRHQRADEELRRIGVVLSPVATLGRVKS